MDPAPGPIPRDLGKRPLHVTLNTPVDRLLITLASGSPQPYRTAVW